LIPVSGARLRCYKRYLEHSDPPRDTQIEFEYDQHNNLIKATDPYRKYVTTEYNTDNLPTKVIEQKGVVTRMEYDREGRVTASIDGTENVTIFRYDESTDTPVTSDRPVQIDYPTYTRKFNYDTRQRVVGSQDILDENTTHTTGYEYDAAGNVVTTTDPENKIR